MSTAQPITTPVPSNKPSLAQRILDACGKAKKTVKRSSRSTMESLQQTAKQIREKLDLSTTKLDYDRRRQRLTELSKLLSSDPLLSAAAAKADQAALSADAMIPKTGKITYAAAYDALGIAYADLQEAIKAADKKKTNTETKNPQTTAKIATVKGELELGARRNSGQRLPDHRQSHPRCAR